MRILIAGYAYEDSFVENVGYTLESMGHEVRTLGEATHTRHHTKWRYYWRRIREELLKGSVQPDEKRLLTMAREFRPQVVLALTREYSGEMLDELKRICGPALVVWWGDSPANTRRWGYADLHWDLVFIKDQAAVEKTRLVRSDVHLLHEAMNPAWHKPVAEQGNQNIVVAGNYYPFRQLLVDRLLTEGYGMELYGPTPPSWSLNSVRKAHTGKYIFREDKSQRFGEGMACLNSFSPPEGNSLNCRAFEIAGAGGLQLIEYRPVIEQCFEPYKELLVFRTYEELQAHIEHAVAEPEKMQKIRAAGAARALAEHTYQHRLEFILSCLR